MTPLEELDLARAKMLRKYSEYVVITDTQFLELARAIRLGDEARGLRVVPAEATQDMSRAYIDAMPISPGTETWTMARIPSSHDVWSAMLAASPFAPEEKG